MKIETLLSIRRYLSQNLYVVFYIIFFCSLILRFYGLDKESFWNDELASWDISNQSTINGVLDRSYGDNNPPGYYLILYFIQKYIGSSEFLLRLPSALAGTLSVGMIFLLARKLYSDKEAVFSALFMGFSWFPIYYSQDARSYSLLLLFSLLTSYLWLFVRDSFTNKPFYRNQAITYSFLYLVAAIITCYLHYFGVYIIFLQGIALGFSLMKKRSNLLPAIILYLLVLLSYVPWFDALLYTIQKEKGWVQHPVWHKFLNYLGTFLGDGKNMGLLVLFYYCKNNLNITQWENIRMITVWRKFTDIFHPTVLLSYWLVLPYVIVYFKSIILSPILTPRNMIIVLPAVYILLARAFSKIKFNVWHTMILLLMIFYGISSKNYYFSPQKEQAREAVYHVVNSPLNNPDSIIIVYNYGRQLQYYFEKTGTDVKIEGNIGRKEDVSIVTEIIMEKKPIYVWYIYSHRQPEKEFLDFLRTEYHLVQEQKFKKAGVLLLKISY